MAGIDPQVDWLGVLDMITEEELLYKGAELVLVRLWRHPVSPLGVLSEHIFKSLTILQTGFNLSITCSSMLSYKLSRSGLFCNFKAPCTWFYTQQVSINALCLCLCPGVNTVP